MSSIPPRLNDSAYRHSKMMHQTVIPERGDRESNLTLPADVSARCKMDSR